MRIPQNEARRWFEQAEYDLKVARWNSQGQLWSASCFWCQQAAEKAAKAFLIAQGAPRVFGHSVTDLGQRCADLDPALDDIVTAGVVLDRFYIPTRYPDALPGSIPGRSYLPSDGRTALELAEMVVGRIATALGFLREPHDDAEGDASEEKPSENGLGSDGTRSEEDASDCNLSEDR